MLTLPANQFQLSPIFQFSPKLLLSHRSQFIMATWTPAPVARVGISPRPVLRQEPFRLLSPDGALLRFHRRHHPALGALYRLPLARHRAGRGNQNVWIVASQAERD